MLKNILLGLSQEQKILLLYSMKTLCNKNYNKINVNSKNFLQDISYCIGEQKLNILAQGVRK